MQVNSFGFPRLRLWSVVSAWLNAPETAGRNLENVVEDAEQAAVLVLAY